MAEQEIVFELADGSHAQAVLDFLNQVLAETDLVTDDPARPRRLDQLSSYLDTLDNGGSQLCLLALLGDEVVGLVSLVGKANSGQTHVVDLFIAVRKAYWGYGLGTALLDNALDWVQQTEGIHRVELSVQKRNSSAIALYQKMGFETEGVQARALTSKEGDYLDLCLMAKWID